jgi:hypothetical protein
LERVWQPNGHYRPGEETTSVFDEFFGNLVTFSALYDKLESDRSVGISSLLRRGRQVQRGMANWTKHDLEEIVGWRRIQSLMPKIEGNIELSLARAFALQDEESSIEALCRIPGIGPVLASLLLTLTSPEKYAPLDNHAWNALSRLGFEIRKRPFSGGGYTAHELVRYTKIVRSLAKSMNMLPWDVAKALHALDKVNTKTKWKNEFDLIRLTSSQPASNSKPYKSSVYLQ